MGRSVIEWKSEVFPVDHLFNELVERDWRDKQKVMDSLKDTVDKQRRDLDSTRKEIMEKEMLCAALRVSIHLRVLDYCLHRSFVQLEINVCLCVTETDDVFGNATG